LNSETFVTSFIDQSSFVVVNEKMIKMLNGDCTCAVLLARLISLYNHFKSNDTLSDGWFFQKVKDIEQRLGINDYFQRKCFTFMVKKGFIKTKIVGSPPIRYFSINFKAIEKALVAEAEFVPKKESKPVDKSSFYSVLNANDDVEALDVVKGNIPRPIAEFLFAYKRGLGYSFAGWNPESYGIISRYLDKTYFEPNRAFSYVRLRNWLNSSEPKTIKSFLSFDRLAQDDMEKPVSFKKFLKELE